MSVASDKRKDLDIPKNVQLYTVDYSGHIIPLMSDLSGQLSVDVTIGDIIAIISGSIISKVSGETVKTASLGTTVSGNAFSVGTSGTQFPNVAGRKFDLALLISNVVYIAGASTVNSGTGYIIAGDAKTDMHAYYAFEGSNLNLLYGKAETTSGIICFLATV